MIDLHIHSTFSDGSDDVGELIDKISRAGIDTFSITDHDTAMSARTILGDEALKAKIRNSGLSYVVGTEWTCSVLGHGTHILAYDFDPFAPEVLELESEIKALLKQKNELRLKAIEDMGYKFSQKSMEFLASRINIKRVNIANCLVDDGYFATLSDAMEKCINTLVLPKKYKLDGEKVIKTLSGIGAKMVWAHSIRGLNHKPMDYDELERVLIRMKECGLVGLECYYSLYTGEEIEKLKELAKKHGLFITAGSDYHGNSRNASLGVTSADGTAPKDGEIQPNKIFEHIFR